jgi:hypothetical protein
MRLIFHFNAVLIFIFEKIGIACKELFRIRNPGTITVRRISCKGTPPSSYHEFGSSRLHCIQGITSSRTRNPPQEWLPRMWRGNTCILPGITSSRTRNPPEEWVFRRELPAQGLGSSVAEPHHFFAAPATRTNFYAAPAPAPAPTQLYSKAKFFKRPKV